jgi:hypothetical protein
MFGNGGGGKGENLTTCKANFQKKFKFWQKFDV